MAKNIQEKLKDLGELLARSMLSPEIKRTILANASVLTEENVDSLIDSLKKESSGLEELTKSLKDFQREADAKWKDAELAQKKEAEEWAAAVSKNLLAE